MALCSRYTYSPIFLGLCVISTGFFCIFNFLKSKSRHLTFGYFLACMFFIGTLRAQHAALHDHLLDTKIGNKVSLSGVICDEPQTKATAQTFCFQPDTGGDKIRLSTYPYPRYTFGEHLTVTGKLSVPKNFVAYDGGPEFDYVSYLEKDGIRYTMFEPHIRSEGIETYSLQRFLFGIKHAFTSKAEELLPEPESSLLGGILLGDKQGLSKETTVYFKNAGLIHILVLSGYNVTIVAESFMKLFSWLPPLFGQSLGVASIILFALMTGASSTTVRASIMALIAIGGRARARRYNVTRALICAGVSMVFINPAILVFDISFQLSFMSTLALLYVSPLVSDRIGFITEKYKLREMIATTLSTLIFTAPFIVYSMGQLSLISLISNILVGPVIPLAMFLGFMALVVGFMSSMAALPLAWITTVILSYVLHVTIFLGGLPFAFIHIQTGVATLVCMYSIYVIVLIILWRRRNASQPSAN